MILEKMPTVKLQGLRAEVEAMIVTKAAVRRREIQSQLSKLLESARAVAAAPDARPAPRR
jgi:hypothetical protein